MYIVDIIILCADNTFTLYIEPFLHLHFHIFANDLMSWWLPIVTHTHTHTYICMFVHTPLSLALRSFNTFASLLSPDGCSYYVHIQRFSPHSALFKSIVRSLSLSLTQLLITETVNDTLTIHVVHLSGWMAATKSTRVIFYMYNRSYYLYRFTYICSIRSITVFWRISFIKLKSDHSKLYYYKLVDKTVHTEEIYNIILNNCDYTNIKFEKPRKSQFCFIILLIQFVTHFLYCVS